MPCYITYKAYATISEKDYASFINAVKSLGMNVVEQGDMVGDTVTISDSSRTATLTRAGLTGGYELDSRSPTFCKRLMEEHNIQLVEKEVRKKGRRTRRTTNKQGQLELIVIG